MNLSKFTLVLFVAVVLISCGKDKKDNNAVYPSGGGVQRDSSSIYDQDEIDRDIQGIMTIENELASFGLVAEVDESENGFVHASWNRNGFGGRMTNNYMLEPVLSRYHHGLKRFVGKYNRFRRRGGHLDAQSLENLAQWRGKLQLCEESLQYVRLGRPVQFARVTVRVR